MPTISAFWRGPGLDSGRPDVPDFNHACLSESLLPTTVAKSFYKLNAQELDGLAYCIDPSHGRSRSHRLTLFATSPLAVNTRRTYP